MASFLTQARSIRIGPFAVFDFAAAFGGMWYLATTLKLPVEPVMWSVLPISVLAHMMTGQSTPLTKMTMNQTLSTESLIAKTVMLICIYKLLASSLA